MSLLIAGGESSLHRPVLIVDPPERSAKSSKRVKCLLEGNVTTSKAYLSR